MSHNILNEMLYITTDLLFEEEKALFYDRFHCQSGIVYDIGSGNGVYLSRLQDNFPALQYHGIEIDHDLYHLSKRLEGIDLQFHHASYDQFQLIHEEKCSLILCRLVIHHLPDQHHFLRWAYERLHTDGILLIIDVDDKGWDDNGMLPLWMKMYHEARRHLVPPSWIPFPSSMRLLLEAAGFNVNTTSYNIVGTDREMKDAQYRYMKLVAESFYKGELPEALRWELQQWLTDPDARLCVSMLGFECRKSK